MKAGTICCHCIRMCMSTVKEVGLTNESRHYLVSLHKKVHEKRDLVESLHTTLIGLE